MILFLISFTLQAQPEVYGQLHNEIKDDVSCAKQVEKSDFFMPYKAEIRALESCLQQTDVYLAEDDATDMKVYLTQLRKCEKISKKFDGHYVSALRESIAKDNYTLFQLLVETNPRILQRDRWVEKSVSYYKKSREIALFAAGESLLEASEEEDNYRQMAALEMQDYEANVKVLSYAKAKQSRNKEGLLRTFFVGYEKRGNDVVLIAENNNAYPVTLSVKLSKVINYTSTGSMPHHTEVDPFSKSEIMRFSRKEAGKKSSLRWSYSWVMGRENVHHDKRYLYALPFKKGSSVIVSQGFNGESTHMGSSKYAVDFVAEVGTPVYAARGGKVISTESSFDKGGFEQSFGKYANYITIQHTDHTMGKYYHLQHDGVKVKVGQYVSKGQFIGLSGNTGFSSGAHLHFGVYKVGNDHRLITVPFKFQTNLGVVDTPKRGDIFKAVR